MKSLNVAIPSLLVTSLFAACAVSDEPIVEELADPTALPAPADPDEPAAAPELGELGDARAAAAEFAAKAAKEGSVGALGLNSTWFSGTIAPGASKGWVWNNASHTAAFAVGLSPIGATTTTPCKFEVSRLFDRQKFGGEREVVIYIKNTGTLSCGANVSLGSETRFTGLAVAGLAPGASTSFLWNNANPVTASHIISVDPSGATSGDDCEMEVTRIWYTQQSSGERELRFTVKNVGSIACQGTANIALAGGETSSWGTGVINAGDSATKHWNNAMPLDRIYVPALSPGGSPFFSPCTMEVTTSYYRQIINTNGTPEREFYFTIKNSGSVNCFGSVLLNHVD